jgi:hypothetical protein
MVSTAGADAAGADDTLTVMPTGDRETLPFDTTIARGRLPNPGQRSPMLIARGFPKIDVATGNGQRSSECRRSRPFAAALLVGMAVCAILTA